MFPDYCEFCLQNNNNIEDISSNETSLSISWIREGTSQQFLEIFTQHLVRKAAGCFLYVKFLLDFLEKGHIVIKSDSFKLLPQTLSEIYQLAFNLMFSSSHSFEHIPALMISICLASLRPMTLSTLYMVMCSSWLVPELSWDQVQAQYQAMIMNK